MKLRKLEKRIRIKREKIRRKRNGKKLSKMNELCLTSEWEKNMYGKGGFEKEMEKGAAKRVKVETG